MTDFLTGAELASYLERDESAALDNIAARASRRVLEAWAHPVDPAPQWVIDIAWDVALRAGGNVRGVTSSTRSFDDVSITDRWEAGQRLGVYLTDEEKAELRGDGTASAAVAPKSIPMSVPGWSRPEGFPCY